MEKQLVGIPGEIGLQVCFANNREYSLHTAHTCYGSNAESGRSPVGGIPINQPTNALSNIRVLPPYGK